MNLNKNDVHSFAQAQLDTFNLSEFKIDIGLALGNISAEIKEEFEELNSYEVMQERHSYFSIDGVFAEEYRERVIQFDDDRKLIYGIRHMGGNVDIPFIQFLANFNLTTNEALSLYENVKHEFIKFKPLYICFHSSGELKDVDMISATHLVTTTSGMKSLKPWPLEQDLSFKVIKDDSYYEWYKSGYEEFNREVPELSKKVCVNTHESMEESMKQGLLQLVFLGDEQIGLISAERSAFLGHDGIYFHEIFIDKKWKGKGLAKAIQRKFVVENTNDADYVWGTIDYSNLSSFKTALSNGRKPVRYENFVSII
ncbi:MULTISPECIES: hypothetical protein [unclassified Halobacteriovorax]|uniref:hypothetical protein n=1 Tax=unclassified Halobacteriovorax TaxID=2639665 RepID=UPI00399C2101